MNRVYQIRYYRSLLLIALVGVGYLAASCDIFDIHDRLEPNYPCENGMAKGIYACDQIDLFAHLSPEELGGETLNDIWGWTDPKTDKKYALVGLNNGVVFVDITRPSSPKILGRLPSHPPHEDHPHTSQAHPGHFNIQHESSWGDMKVYKNHMYAVSEETGHGIHVFDLTRLRNIDTAASGIFSVDHVYDSLSTAHNININTETGYAYAVGTDGATCEGRGLHMIDLQDPKNPKFAGCFNEGGYIHDTQCVIYRGPDSDYRGQELCFNSNADKFTIVDVTDKENPQLVSSMIYEGLGYVHQGWLTENHHYFLLGDEFDELQNGHNLRTYVVDVKDLENPSVSFHYEGDTPSIDHNLFVKGNYVYQSNYTSGIFILSLAPIEQGNLNKVAYFDTYPRHNEPEFNGTWSNYPFFDNNVLIASDITGGLFILYPRLY